MASFRRNARPTRPGSTPPSRARARLGMGPPAIATTIYLIFRIAQLKPQSRRPSAPTPKRKGLRAKVLSKRGGFHAPKRFSTRRPCRPVSSRSGAIAFMRRALLSRNRFFLRKEARRQGSGKDEKRKEALEGGGERKGRVGESMRGGERGGGKKRKVCVGGGEGKRRSPAPPSFFLPFFPASSMKVFIAGLICLANRNEKTRNRERKKKWGRKEEKDQGEKRPPQAGRKNGPSRPGPKPGGATAEGQRKKSAFGALRFDIRRVLTQNPAS